MFLVGNTNGYFEKAIDSAQHLTIAVNLSTKHHFLGFFSQSLDVEGSIDYLVYNRFPPGGYLSIKMVTLPFQSSLSGQIYVARLLMLMFFAGAAVLAYWSLCRLTPSRWIALTATLVVFSSAVIMSVSTTVLTEGAPDFFGFVLVFHGMVLFVQEGRFRQLVIKSCIALLFGWHVLALLSVFVVLGLIKEVTRACTAEAIRKIVVAIVMSRHFILGAVAFGFGILILAHNMGNEYYALNIRGAHQIRLSDLPSIHSMLLRTGVAEELTGDPSWGEFLSGQFRRLSRTIVPLALADFFWPITDSLLASIEPILFTINMDWLIRSSEFYFGVLAVSVCVVGVFKVRYRLLAATAVFGGFCWTLPMHNNTGRHLYEALYYVGISLFFCTIILLLIRKLIGERFIIICSLFALLIFAFSNHQRSRIEYDRVLSIDIQKSLIDDYDVIRTFTREKNVFVPLLEAKPHHIEVGGSLFWLHYFLSGSRILFNDFGCDRSLGWADFMVQTRRDVGPGLLTPDNEVVYLYDRRVHEEYVDSLVEGGVLVVRGDFDVYLTEDRRLVYVSDRCDGVGSGLFLGVPISLSIYPVDAADLPDPERGHEFHELAYVEHLVLDTSRHVVIFDLPDYRVARIVTGQYGEGGRIWGGGFLGPDYAVDANLMALADRAAAGGGPVARGRFDVYLTDDGSLVYVKEPCRDADVDDGFFVHVVPADGGDLPEHRRQSGFDNLDFAFFDRGTSDGLRCAAAVDLPDYDIVGITTGQYNDQGPTWQNEIRPPK